MELSSTVITRPSRRRRQTFALVAIAVAILASVAAFGLANTGNSEAEIKPLPGSEGGAVAVVTAMSSKVTRPNGGAQLNTGVALARIAVAQAAASHIRVNVSWTNVQEVSGGILGNPNSQISIGLYHPIHSGECTSSDKESNKGKEIAAPRVTIEDTNAEKLCGALDEASTGSSTVSAEGKLLLTKTLIGGFMEPSIAGKAALNACSATAEAWCHTETVKDENQDPLYLVASIVTPGGIPQGQQSVAGSLKFFVNVKRLH